jgi:hypothetical protein
MKPEPNTVTGVPPLPLPLFGLIVLTVGDAVLLKVYTFPLVTEPNGEVTVIVTSSLLVESGGVVHVIDPAETDRTLAATAPLWRLKVTVVGPGPVRFEPVIVTTWFPVVDPDVGVTALKVGGGPKVNCPTPVPSPVDPVFPLTVVMTTSVVPFP